MDKVSYVNESRCAKREINRHDILNMTEKALSNTFYVLED